MLKSSVILDIAILVVLIVSVYIGARKGLFRSLAELVVYLVGLVGASMVSGALTDKVVGLLRPALESKVSDAISAYIADTLADVPFGGYLSGLDGLGDLAGDASQEMVDLLVETLLYNLAYVLVYLLAFLVIVLALRLVINMGDLVMHLPVLHEMNTLGGLLAGAAKGVVLVCLVLWLDSKTGLLLASSAVKNSYIAPLLLGLFPAA